MVKAFNVTSPRAILNNTSWVTNEIDTKGFRYVTIYGILGANDIALTVWKVQESDTTGSGFVDITTPTTLVAVGTTGDGRLPTGTDDDTIFGFFIDMKGRKRFLDVVATNGNGSTGGFIAIIALLSRAEEAPNTTTERGLAGFMRV
jgi:hypothetical protein